MMARHDAASHINTYLSHGFRVLQHAALGLMLPWLLLIPPTPPHPTPPIPPYC